MSESIGFLFPGQGSQSVGMGRAFCDAFPGLRDLYDEASAILSYDLGALCFDGPAERLNQTEYTQPALLVTSVVALRLVEQAGIQPAAVAGHSLGEYSALVAAGGLSFADAVNLVHKRATYMAQAVPAGSGMVAAVLGMTIEQVEDACDEARAVGVVSAANFNSPGQIVIAGERAAVERANELLKKKGCRRIMTLPVSVPVHTSLMSPAADRLSADVAAVSLSDLRVPLINNAEAQPLWYAEDIRASLIRQLPSSVRWEQSMHKMSELGITTFIEIGPGTVLTGLLKRILSDAVLLNVHEPESRDVTLQRVRAKV